MLARRAASPAVWTARARRDTPVSYVRDRIRLGHWLLTHRTYPIGRNVTYSSGIKGSGAAAVDRRVDRTIGATTAIGAISGTTLSYPCR